MAELRWLLEQPGSYPPIRSLVCWPLPPHVGQVYERLERAGDPDDPGMAALRLAVLVHEEAPERVGRLLEAAGLADLAPVVSAVVANFGALWKLAGDDELRRYVEVNRPHLAGLLLFELAHEGRPTARMAEAAAGGGIAPTFARWAGRLIGDPQLRPA